MNGGSILLSIPREKKIVAKILFTIEKVAGLMTFGIFLQQTEIRHTS